MTEKTKDRLVLLVGILTYVWGMWCLANARADEITLSTSSWRWQTKLITWNSKLQLVKKVLKIDSSYKEDDCGILTFRMVPEEWSLFLLSGSSVLVIFTVDGNSKNTVIACDVWFDRRRCKYLSRKQFKELIIKVKDKIK